MVAFAIGLAGPVAAQSQNGARQNGAAVVPLDPIIVGTEEQLLDPQQGKFVVKIPPIKEEDRRNTVSTSTNSAASMVNRLYRTGRAAGLDEVIYDNRDEDHSRINLERYPNLRQTRYANGARARQYHRGLPGLFLFDTPVVGNASLAVTRRFGRSLPRLALQNQLSTMDAYNLFANNQLYVYPEHRDHDPERGDLFHAQTPYAVISQGSSRSDRPFVAAMLLTYAAFQPETFDRLRINGLLPATAQMVMRRTQRDVTGPDDYLSPRAHPTAFDSTDLRPGAMVALAASMKPDEIPPIAQLKVLEDFNARPGTDYLATNLSEHVFTTPNAIARTWRSFEGQRRMTVTAADTRDPNGHPLTFHWVLLRGNPELVTIETEGVGNATAEITMNWHSVEDLAGPDGMAAQRIEIGVFADNGFHRSAPSFVSIAVPVHQDRSYAGEGADAKIWQIDYRHKQGTYFDPVIWPDAPWDDRMAHGPDGKVDVITRRYDDAPLPSTLHVEGRGIWSRKPDGGDGEAQNIKHVASGPPRDRLSLKETPVK